MAYNPILHAESHQYYWKGTGALSIKTFKNGRVYYNTGRGHFAVEEENYLILNHGQEYSITIESETLVESFCVFFPLSIINDVHRSLISSNNEMLDTPFDQTKSSTQFVEKTYYNNPALSSSLLHLRNNYRDRDELWLEEKLHELSCNLLFVHRRVQEDIRNLPLLKSSTKEEIYKRIHIGRDYILAYYNKQLSLTEMAKIACLSPNYFLRHFKLMFDVTPHQFLTEKRLQEARRLLFNTQKSVTDVCFDVGYESPSTFSTLFTNRFGLSPSNLRKK
jgi:AraC family transcriptional regulator